MKLEQALAIALLLTAAAVAQKDKDSAKPPSQSNSTSQAAAPAAAPANAMPQPSPEIQKLEKWLVGRWKVEEKFEPSDFLPKGGEGKGMETIHSGPGKLSLVANYQSQGPMGAFEGHGMIAWSPQEKVYKSYWVDNLDPPGEVSIGKWEGKDLVFTYISDMMGKKMIMKEVYTDITPDSYTFYFDLGPQGQPLKRTMTFKYIRAEAPVREGRGSRDSEPPQQSPPKQ